MNTKRCWTDEHGMRADRRGPVPAQVQKNLLVTPAFQCKSRLLCDVGKSLVLTTEEDPLAESHRGAMSRVESIILNVTGPGISFCEVTTKSNSGIVSH